MIFWRSSTSETMNMFTLTHALLLFCSMVSHNDALSFVSRTNLKSNVSYTRIKSPISNRGMSMSLMVPSLSFENIDSMVSQTMRIQNQNIQAEIFGDLAHATLDGATLLSLSPVILRLFIFVGRIFAILADYLPDHAMTPDETIFQLLMLILSGRSLYNDTVTLVTSYTKSTSFKDRKIYLIAFLPVGFSWMQYKLLISNALEWVELSPGKCVLEENDSLLLVYRGDVHQDIDGINIQQYGICNQINVLDIVGDLFLAKELIDSKFNKKRRIKNVKPTTIDNVGQPQTRYVLKAGSDGSLLLRIKVKKLLDIANKDEQLFGSIKNLVSNGIQNRLIASLNEQ